MRLALIQRRPRPFDHERHVATWTLPWQIYIKYWPRADKGGSVHSKVGRGSAHVCWSVNKESEWRVSVLVRVCSNCWTRKQIFLLWFYRAAETNRRSVSTGLMRLSMTKWPPFKPFHRFVLNTLALNSTIIINSLLCAVWQSGITWCVWLTSSVLKLV